MDKDCEENLPKELLHLQNAEEIYYVRVMRIKHYFDQKKKNSFKNEKLLCDFSQLLEEIPECTNYNIKINNTLTWFGGKKRLTFNGICKDNKPSQLKITIKQHIDVHNLTHDCKIGLTKKQYEKYKIPIQINDDHCTNVIDEINASTSYSVTYHYISVLEVKEKVEMLPKSENLNNFLSLVPCHSNYDIDNDHNMTVTRNNKRTSRSVYQHLHTGKLTYDCFIGFSQKQFNKYAQFLNQ